MAPEPAASTWSGSAHTAPRSGWAATEVTDVTEHPATRGGAREIARLYDLQQKMPTADSRC